MGGVPRGGCIFARHLVCVVASVSCRSSSLFFVLQGPPKKKRAWYFILLCDARYSKVASSMWLRFLPPNFMRTATTKKDNTLFLWLLYYCRMWCWGRIRTASRRPFVRMICAMISPVPGYATPRGTCFLTCPARQEIGRS